MTKSRSSIHRELYGLLGPLPNASQIQADWNVYFAKQEIDAFMGKYPATVDTLPERLSEMFHFDRRIYIVSEKLGASVMPFLDQLDETAQMQKDVDVIVNRDGVLTGYFLGIRSACFDEQRSFLDSHLS